MMVSTEGVDIEGCGKDARKDCQETIDPAVGMMPYQARKLTAALGIKGDLINSAAKLLLGVYKTWWECDGAMVEINPLCIVEGADGKDALVAVDARSALMTTPSTATKISRKCATSPRKRRWKSRRANSISITSSSMEHRLPCHGAGLAMATMDIIQHFGGSPANFLDVGGGASKDQVTAAFKIILSDPHVKGILVNIFGGIMDCNVIATGIVAAVRETGSSCRLLSVSKVTTSRPARKPSRIRPHARYRRFHGRRGAESC